MSSPTPKTRMGSSERRQHLIDVSIELFARRSYATVTTAQIAGKAGVSEAIIYRHFKSKKALFLACFQEGIADYLIGRYRKLWVTLKDDPRGYLRAVGLEYFRFVNERPMQARFLALMLTASYDADISRALHDFLEINVKTVAQVCKRIFEDSPPSPPIHPRRAAWLFVGHYYTLVVLKELFPKDAGIKSIKEMFDFSWRP